MITIQRPYAFLGLLILIPITVYVVIRYKKIARYLGFLYLKDNSVENKAYRRLRLSVILRTIFRLMSCVFVVFAYAGISWGTKSIPVQKSGDAVSLVFDISWSMMAQDGPEGLSRLEAARRYAWGLLDHMEGTSVSVVLAKGDGVIAVPLTDDRASVDSIIESLSPSLMTAAGSSIGKGVTAAMKSFPQNMSQAGHIWVFTDGDETDSGLSSALDDAARFGIPVTLIGFGTKIPVEVTAGDRKTKVKTFLNEEKMQRLADSANEKIVMPHRHASRRNIIDYVPADSEGSAYVLLRHLSEKTSTGDSYEMQSVPHHLLFILFAILSLAASFFASEFDIHNVVKKKASSVLMIFMILSSFTSCKSGKSDVLSGTFNWYQKKYQRATAEFLRANTTGQETANKKLSDYSAYNLASTYIMQEEYEAALSRLEEVSPDSDGKLKSAVFYNSGIIAARQGDYDQAEKFFKEAVLADSSNINAKLNLEFTHQQVETRQSKALEKQMTAVNIDKGQAAMANAVFTLIQQEEKERWKNLQSDQKENSSVDY